jgi:PAS domain S-box-containing protein
MSALISRWARRRRAYAENDARLADFVRASADWYWETDTEGRYTWVSPGVEPIFGRPAQWYLGRRRVDVITAGAGLAAEPWRSHHEALQKREPFRDLVFRYGEGDSACWVRSAGTPYYDAAGRFLGYRGVATDVSERVETERRASVVEERLRGALENLTELVSLTDAEDRIIYANRGFREFNAGVAAHLEPGERYEEHLRAGMALGYYPDAIGKEEEWLAERMALRRRSSPPVERRRQDGKWLLVTDQRLPQGGIITVGLDITERKKAEEALRRSESLVRLVTESVPALIAYYSIDRVCRFANRRYAESFGLSAETAVGKPLREIVGAAANEEIEARLAAAGPNDTVRYERAIGGEAQTVIDVALTPDVGPDGTPRGYFVLIADVSERREAERRLRDSEARLSALVDSAQEVIIIVDAAHCIRAFNPAAEKIFGYQAQEVLGGPLARLIPERFREAHRAHMAGYAASGATSRRMGEAGRVTGLRAAGTEFPADASIAQFEAGGERFSAVMLRDVTDQVRVQRELQELNATLERRVGERTAELETTLRELESFSYTVSHDLRAPARATAGFARIVDDDYGALLPDEARGLLLRIAKAGADMGAMIDGLLDMARITRRELERQPLDLGALAAEVWRDLAAAEPGRAVEFHVTGTPLRIEGDPVLLKHLLLNLLDNARKYTRGRADAEVWFGCTTEGEYFVRDNGVGFDMVHACKLFGEFQRLHGEREFEGHGIGLAIARRIVERHGGRIRAEAEPGRGAVFYFSLRRAPH